MIRIRTYRGQGMTEYIIIVGLVAILAMAAVARYRYAVDEAIQGTDGAGGIGGSVNGIGKTDNQYSDAPADPDPEPDGSLTPAGNFNGKPVFRNKDNDLVYSDGRGLSADEVNQFNGGN